ncbi:thiamine phosphate synthase [Patescibacteria group bacterium]|nr:thiamine phosphate synthase [Patescibacteria group bacterium]
MAELVPAILTKSEVEFRQKIRQVETLVASVQIDVMDGSFVPNETFNEIDKIATIKTNLQYKIHLMVNDIGTAVKNWSRLQPARITFPAEAVNLKKIKDIVLEAKRGDYELGMALNPETKLSVIEEVEAKIDFVLIMGVNPGFSGQKLQTGIVERIKQTKNDYPDIKVGVDGGIKIDNAAELVAAGVDELAVGSAVFASKNIVEAVRNLQVICRS